MNEEILRHYLETSIYTYAGAYKDFLLSLLDRPVLVVYACTCLDEVGKIPWVMGHYRKYGWVKDLPREIT